MERAVHINKNGNLEVDGVEIDLNIFLEKLNMKPTVFVQATPPDDYKVADFWYDTNENKFNIAKFVNNILCWTELPFNINNVSNNGSSGNVTTEMLAAVSDALTNSINSLNVKNVNGVLVDNNNVQLTYTKEESNLLSRGFKNLIINGGFDIWQRGESFENIQHSTFTADRFCFYGSGTCDISRIFEDNKNKCRIKQNTIGAFQALRTTVENVNHLMGKTITISYNIEWIIPNNSAYLYTRLRKLSDYSPVTPEQSIAIPQTNGRYFFTFTLHSVTDLCFLDIRFHGNNTDQANFDFKIYDIQLEYGSISTPFEQRPYGLELLLCQRYYCRFVQVLTGGVGFKASSSASRFIMPFPVTMRDVPTIGISHYSHFSTYGIGSTEELTFLSVSEATTEFVRLYTEHPETGTGGNGAFLLKTNNSGYIDFDAEI